MLLEKRSLALVLEYIMANILCFYPNGALEQGFSQLEIQVGGGPAKGPGDHTPVVKLGIQSSMTRDNMDKSWSKKFENQCCSLKPCLFWAENRHALVCRPSQMNCNFVPVYRQRKSSFFWFPPSHLFFLLPRSFYTHSKPSIKWFQCVVMLREVRDPDEAQRVGNPWLSSFLFLVTQLQAISTRQMNYFQFTAIFKWKSC